MNRKYRKILMVIAAVLTLSFAMQAAASDDNSLADLGIQTPGCLVTPDFRYDIWEYNVEVPAGTKELQIQPRTTHPNATIESVTGTELNDDGTGRVVITIMSESGNPVEYALNIVSKRANQDPAEAISANLGTQVIPLETEVLQSEVETEDPKYVKVDRNSLKDAENTIEKLQETIREMKTQIRTLTYIVYGVIGLAVLFLLLIIILLIRKRDQKLELKEYRRQDPNNTKGKKKKEQLPDDGWGEWEDDEPSASNRPVNAQTNWQDTQVGTPIPPQRMPAPGDPRYQAASESTAKQGYEAKPAKQPKAAKAAKQTGTAKRGAEPSAAQPLPGDSTKLYQAASAAAQPIHPQDVPKSVTKDLSRVNKAEAKALKKAAAAQAKAEQEAKKAAQTRLAEAKRQADEAKRLHAQNEKARAAQEAAIRKVEQERAAAESVKEAKMPMQDSAPRNVQQSGKRAARKSGKDVRIDMIDL